YSRTEDGQRAADYLPASSLFTASLTTLPSTRAPAKRAMSFFITAAMSLIVGDPISDIICLPAQSTHKCRTVWGQGSIHLRMCVNAGLDRTPVPPCGTE